ncbi:MAG TPA: hypothetical protein VJI33_01830 [Candidatus Paceibacterota bacterium]
MFGFLLVIGSSFLSEISDIIGKKKMKSGEVSIYTTGFLTLVFGVLFFLFTAFSGGSFRFSVDSLPTLITRIILEIILSWVTITALARANRSTFGFIRTLTIPLLLIADLIIGYAISPKQIFGIIIITAIIASFIILSGRFEKRGLGLLLLSSTLPVATLSLYKYNISNFNSVEAEQIIVSSALTIFFLLMALFKAKENPFKFLLKPVFFLQAMAVGLASVIGSFAYLFLLPSIVIAVSRSSAVLFATLSGDFYFKENKPWLKLFIAIGIVIGLIFLV